MTRIEYHKYIQALKEHGYGCSINGYTDKKSFYKVLEYRNDENGDIRAVCQLVFYLYEIKDNHDTYYSIEPVILVSRNVDERLDLIMPYPQRSIEELERIAKEFIQWVDVTIKPLDINESSDNEKN